MKKNRVLIIVALVAALMILVTAVAFADSGMGESPNSMYYPQTSLSAETVGGVTTATLVMTNTTGTTLTLSYEQWEGMTQTVILTPTQTLTETWIFSYVDPHDVIISWGLNTMFAGTLPNVWSVRKDAQAVTTTECEGSEWHVVSTSQESVHPRYVNILWADGEVEAVPLDDSPASVGHYYTGSHGNGAQILEIWTYVHQDWAASLNLSHKPCSPTAIVFAQGEDGTEVRVTSSNNDGWIIGLFIFMLMITGVVLYLRKKGRL